MKPKASSAPAAVALEARVTRTRSTIAANIRARREAASLSQEGLAEAAELSPIYIAALEQARPSANPTLRALVAVAAALQCDLSDLTKPAALVRRNAGRPTKPTRQKRRA